MTQKNKNIIDSMEALEARRADLSVDIEKSEEELSKIWNTIFRQPTEEERNSPTQRALAFISSSAGLIDGALLGWKLYHKFGGSRFSFPFFKKKKKK